MFDFQPLTTDCRCELGESPVWDDRRQVLWCCDILGRSVLAVDPLAGRTRRWPLPSEVGGLGLAESGRLIVALRHLVGLFDPDTGAFSELTQLETDRAAATRLNDCKVGPDGAFWVGSMDDAAGAVRQPVGSLYRIDGRGRAEKKIEGIRVSNGLAFSPDGRWLYHSDSRGLWIDRWDFEASTGAISGRKRIAEPDASMGRPDGAAVDVEGCYWSAGVSAGCLNRFSPDGSLVERIPVPAPAPTAPCFGGPDMQMLFITTMIDPIRSGPLCGMILTSRATIAGAPVHRFRDYP